MDPILLPRTTQDQRAPFYEDVETLILNGFLSHSVRIKGISVSLRSLGPGDVVLLKARASSGLDDDWKVWAIASAIWMVDGYCLLDEVHAAPRLAKMIWRLPKYVREVLFSLVSGLFVRQGLALEATEAYCYESISRFRWRAGGGQLPNMHSGIPGVDRMGTNYVQRMWTFFNRVEDAQLEEDATWEGFKLVTSAMAPKGVKKIDTHDKERKKTELEHRQNVADRMFYTRMGVIKPQDEKTTVRPMLGNGSKSADDLVDEMKRWVTGEDDWHDQIVNEYKRKVSERYEQEKQERQRRAAAWREQQIELEESMMPQQMVAYTSEQLQSLLKQRQPGPAGVKHVASGTNSGREYLYEKYLHRKADAGALKVEDGVLVANPGQDLTDQLAQRMVPFQTGSDDFER
jgi:hypothetical protein